MVRAWFWSQMGFHGLGKMRLEEEIVETILEEVNEFGAPLFVRLVVEMDGDVWRCRESR